MENLVQVKRNEVENGKKAAIFENFVGKITKTKESELDGVLEILVKMDCGVGYKGFKYK